MCEAQLWDEALVELKRQNYSPLVKKEEIAWLAKIYLGQEKYEEVVQLQSAARQKGCDITPYLAVAYARLNKPDKALVLAKEALQDRREGAKRAIGDVYFAMGNFERALYWYEQMARSWLDYAEAMTLIGKTLAALGDYREAATAYERAARWSSFRRNEDLLQLAECYQKTGRPHRAAELEPFIETP